MQQRYSMIKIELLAIAERLKVFKAMLWGQRIKVITDHKNSIQYALGLTSDQVSWWRLLLEEYGPEIVHIKCIHNHNTVANAISRLESGQTQDVKANWMMFMRCWCHYTMHAISSNNTYNHQEQLTTMFDNQSNEDVI